jgi:hypothetical protein
MISQEQLPPVVTEKPATAKYWGPWPTFGFGLAVMAVQLASSSIIALLLLLIMAYRDATFTADKLTAMLKDVMGFYAAISTIIAGIVCIAIIIVFIKIKQTSVKDYLSLNRINIKTALIVVGVAVGMIALSSSLNYILKKG